MNPLTSIKNTQKATKREIELGLSESASWHAEFKHSAYVFVGGLDFALTEGDVLAVFSQYGEIVDLNLVRDEDTGKTKGFAFIAYEDQRSTNLAVDNLSGAKVSGRVIRVEHVGNYKKKKAEVEGKPEESGVEREATNRQPPAAAGRQTPNDGPSRPLPSSAPWEVSTGYLALMEEVKQAEAAAQAKARAKQAKKEHKKDKKAKKEKKSKKHREHHSMSSDSDMEAPSVVKAPVGSFGPPKPPAHIKQQGNTASFGPPRPPSIHREKSANDTRGYDQAKERGEERQVSPSRESEKYERGRDGGRERSEYGRNRPDNRREGGRSDDHGNGDDRRVSSRENRERSRERWESGGHRR